MDKNLRTSPKKYDPFKLTPISSAFIRVTVTDVIRNPHNLEMRLGASKWETLTV